ncbi:amino acid transporter AVT1I-like [Gastrolobium bilobum]|uniref:amino acid transporter AVT1I-like n=1 Tax=Gastrolobium bilobum TaxID=150636 RepID=UPI002AB0C961|nr:amino acid transporter AVT1I-like [Gastrolobium bilobum]
MESQSQLQDPHLGQPSRGASFLGTYFNGLNTLLGVGILSTPYALSQGGWSSLILLIFVAVTCWYTGLLLQRCMDKHPQIKSYPDIGKVAFGYKGRVVVATFMYLELYLIAVEFLILGGDCLQYLFPNKNFKIGSLRIGGKRGFILLTALAILPTTWLRSMGVLAYISASGVVASIILISCVLWAGAVDGVGFHQRGQLWKLRELPATLSLFNVCYCAHAVFPTLSNSMRDNSQFSKVLLFCIVTSTITYGFMATIGYLMFGDYSESQVILNLSMKKTSTYIAIYTTLFTTFTKYAVVVTPIAVAIEDTWRSHKSRFVSILIRTIIVVCTMLVAIFVPFFGYIMAFIGAFSGITLAWLLPCLCYLKINVAARRFGLELLVIIGIILTGSIIGVLVIENEDGDKQIEDVPNQLYDISISDSEGETNLGDGGSGNFD